MKKYRQLKKSKRYIFSIDGLGATSAVYKRRYYNKELKQWTYLFKVGIGHEFAIEPYRVFFLDLTGRNLK